MDCEWSHWTKSECLGTCGNGTQTWTREKIIHKHVPINYHYDLHHNQYDHYQQHGYGKRSAYTTATPYHNVGKECIGESTKTVICPLYPCPGM